MKKIFILTEVTENPKHINLFMCSVNGHTFQRTGGARSYPSKNTLIRRAHKKFIYVLGGVLLISIFYILFSIFSVAQAADPLVPCGPGMSKSICQFCDLIILINRVINFVLLDIALPIVAIMVAWGGITMMIAGDNSGRFEEGRKKITAAVFGAVIALGAWLIISEILISVSGNSNLAFTPWKFGSISICK